MSDLSDAISEKVLHQTSSYIKLTNKGTLIYNGWSKERLLSLLKDKLVQYDKIKSSFKRNNICDTSFNKFLHSNNHNGVYNECILLELEKKGMSPYSIMKAIKYGLFSLTSEELEYFQDLGVEMHVIKNPDMWIKKLDEKLIWNLIVVGLTENQCWNIIICGLASQNKNILYRLLRSGADIIGILSWSGQIKPATSTIMHFLNRLEIDEDTLRYVKENGINDEIEDMLIDLGYNEYREKESLKKICRYSLVISESSPKVSSSLSEASFSSSVSTSVNTRYNTPLFTCKCYTNLSSIEQGNKVIKKNNYLRQNVMVPLSWAIGRALRYQPSDPKHYIAHQLLRWKYGNVLEEEVHNTRQFVASATIVMDQRFMEKNKQDDIEYLNESAIEKTDCSCPERLHRILKYHLKCMRMPTQ